MARVAGAMRVGWRLGAVLAVLFMLALFVIAAIGWVLSGPVLALATVLALALIVTARPASAANIDVSPPPNQDLSADTKAILDASPDACIVLSREGMILWANAAARESFGIFSVGNPFSFSMREPDLIRAVEKASRTGLTDKARWSEKVPTSRWYEAFISPFRLAADHDGPRDAIAVFVRDLTEQQQLDRMREDFVANASHELRTPLAALTGFIETLQGPARDDPKAREHFLGIMQTQADRMRRLTDALLSLSRIEMRAHVRPSDLVDVVNVVRTAVELIRPMADEYKVSVKLTAPETPMMLRGDADELVQLIDNLIENAIKYGGDGGGVAVSVAQQPTGAGTAAVIAVQDFGKGIAPEHVPRLTERFYRVDVEVSRARQGTGLGLAIVKHIVARHRGRLTVRSELGAGSTITVKLPMDTQK